MIKANTEKITTITNSNVVICSNGEQRKRGHSGDGPLTTCQEDHVDIGERQKSIHKLRGLERENFKFDLKT
jgi:hypothetical protein